ncbi:response regulator [Paenibacillus sp. sptzw28]|uniref:response regulator transcription factor n=1 Tax=Paenibacillus sp. sptzw28 TaxID=715179 RepID=UPI001C6EBA4B|nr:response regulator [Paenibacillus sp. sptzw28]QYR22768.1 response regulator [Paenibacillus sp. sptzw28]
MYRVLIVDDEPLVTCGIAKLIDWKSKGFTIIGEAYDGLSALQTIREQKPDVVISDIRMPGLDGIELLERLHDEEIEAEVILVSGYAEFAYAQQALKLGAFDYLLKQIDKTQLSKTIERVKEKLDKKKQESKEFDLLLNDLFDLFEPDNKIKIQNFLLNKGYDFSYPHYRFVSCLYPSETASELHDDAPYGNEMNVIRFRTGQNKLSYLINYDELNKPIGFLNFISDHSNDCLNLGISDIGVFSTPIAKLYQESDISLFSAFSQPESRIIAYKESEMPAELTKSIWSIELAIKEQKQELIHRRLDELSEECVSQRLYIHHVSNVYNQIVSLIYKYYSDSYTASEVEYYNYYQIVRQYRSIEQMFDSVKAMFGSAQADIPVSNEEAKRIIEDIDAHFTEEISLNQLAKKYKVSLGYISKLIKKETGKTYSDYIVNRRLSLAKELLSDPFLSIHEIVQRVGYKDYFHFNKLFKKHSGITPSKYRKI